MANLFRRSRQSYDFPLSEIEAPVKKKGKAHAPEAAPHPAEAPPAAPVEEPAAAEAPPASGEPGEPAAGTAQAEEGAVKRDSSTPQLQEPLISPNNFSAPPPPPPKKTRKDFFLCIGLLLVFTAICIVGLVVLKFLVFNGDKALLLNARRKDADHGVFNPDPPHMDQEHKE